MIIKTWYKVRERATGVRLRRLGSTTPERRIPEMGDQRPVLHKLHGAQSYRRPRSRSRSNPDLTSIRTWRLRPDDIFFGLCPSDGGRAWAISMDRNTGPRLRERRTYAAHRSALKAELRERARRLARDPDVLGTLLGSAQASIALRSMPFDQKSAPPSSAMTLVGFVRACSGPHRPAPHWLPGIAGR